MSRTISIEPVTRIEGHARITLQLADTGEVGSELPGDAVLRHLGAAGAVAPCLERCDADGEGLDLRLQQLDALLGRLGGGYPARREQAPNQHHSGQALQGR